ncbi:hypothetical protein Tco_1213120 [Tanacetum coccineum]
MHENLRIRARGEVAASNHEREKIISIMETTRRYPEAKFQEGRVPEPAKVVLSTAHGMLKLPVEGGVITLKSSKLVPLECALVSEPKGNLTAIKPTVEERIKVAINPEYLKQTVMIGSTLTEEGRNKLCDLLQ